MIKQYKYVGDNPRVNPVLRLVTNPEDVIEVDDNAGTIRNITKNESAKIRPELVKGNIEKGIVPIIKRLSEGDGLFKEVKQPNPSIKKGDK